MSKLCTLVLLFYNVVLTLSFSSRFDRNTYDDRGDNRRFNLLESFIENGMSTTEPPYLEHWTGRWMPNGPKDPTPPPKVWSTIGSNHGSKHNLPMGKIDNCDDGKTNLEVDWDNSETDYTCYGTKIIPELSITSLLYIEPIPHAYKAMHKCMDETIEYDDDIPLYGSHRPVWPVYGEYKYLPKQRWLHSLEHGAVVMLYHPCANALEVEYLKKLVKTCLRRYIISPYGFLNEDRPLALLTWGSRLTMSVVNPEIVRDFIRNKSLRGPEEIPDDGDFNEGLISKSEIVSDFSDSTVCPNM